MATIQFESIRPFNIISKTAVSQTIEDVLIHVFKHIETGLWLVGGTAIAGYYANHRQSHDIDLFASDKDTHHASLLAIQSLKQEGAIFLNEQHTPWYYRSLVKFHDYEFNIDLVLDPNVFQVGHAHKLDYGIMVADIKTLFAMKSACLVSRCSEKDLYDLHWIFTSAENVLIQDLVTLGSQIDAGLTIESLLISLRGTLLRKEACSFLLPDSAETASHVYETIVAFKNTLISRLLDYESKKPSSHDAKIILQAIRDQKKFQ
jgi:hypothetical protein